MIVQLMGGLGNQMFQYAFGISVAKQRGLPLEFRGKKTNTDTHIQFMMDVYDVDIKWTDRWSGNSVHQPHTYYEKGMPYDPDVYTQPADTYYFGNWQTEKYFNPGLVRAAFQSPKGLANGYNQAWAKAIISDKNAAFIQVRRGDYLNPTTNAYHGCQTLDYYMKGVSLIREKHPDAVFYVFTDDVQWCIENFPPEFNVITGNRWQDRMAQWDLWLMSKCRHGVMANSSFGWWGAWLGDQYGDRTIVAPLRWFDQAPVDVRDIVPERWIKL